MIIVGPLVEPQCLISETLKGNLDLTEPVPYWLYFLG